MSKKHPNLFKRGRTWYTRLWVRGREVVESTGETTLEAARVVLKQRRKNLGPGGESENLDSVTFAEAAARTLEKMATLHASPSSEGFSATTLAGDRSHLKPESPIVQKLGSLPLQDPRLCAAGLVRRVHHPGGAA